MTAANSAQLRAIVDALQADEDAYVAAADRISELHPDTTSLPEVKAMEAARNALTTLVLEVVNTHLVEHGKPPARLPWREDLRASR